MKKYRTNGPFEFIPLEEARKTCPALPLPPSTITVAEPAKSAVDGRFAASLAGLTSAVYTGRLASREARLSRLAGKQAARLRTQQGVLHALFGRLAEAAMKDDPTLVSPDVNLANVRLIEKGADAALAMVADGLARSPGSMLLNLAATSHVSGLSTRSSRSRQPPTSPVRTRGIP